ncbi:uncharacterized protein LOC133515993 [Cydia pomonella]|uniref:uncharacterized protein LOC133515993 n=1 Tax=Cydia pomonella TaxID=82600 RepID=UPI002ADE7B25|nr:uncharacterized protein LOC133515993 [Cydia pomonella]
MGTLMLVLCVIPSIVTSITVSSNGNSPEVKMFGGMMVDMQKGFIPMTPRSEMTPAATTNYTKSRKINQINSTKLSINERYRRLIPYMTFYYANDLVTPTPESYKNVEVEKAQIIESSTVGQLPDRQPKKIVYSTYRNIPRYQGNRLTHYNIASANPTKIYKEVTYNQAPKVPNYNPFTSEHSHLENQNYGRLTQTLNFKPINIPEIATTHKPYLNLQQNDDPVNIQYYFSEKDHAPKYKLVPYDQTPPVKVLPHNDQVYDAPKRPIAVPVMVSKEPVYIKPRPRPQYVYENVEVQQQIARKQPSIVSENYYEKRPSIDISKPDILGGFKPIVSYTQTTEAPAYTTLPDQPLPHFESQKQHPVQVFETTSVPDVNGYRPNYYEYIVEQPTYKPVHDSPAIPASTMTIGDLLNSLQLNKSIPKPITRENVASSIRTLLQVLNALKAMPPQNEVEVPVLSTPKPFVAPAAVEVTVKPVINVTPASVASAEDLHEEQYLAPVNQPSQHIDSDDYRGEVTSSQSFPLRPHSDDEGGTPGRPGVDYPVLTVIPATAFNCKTQRYKGFFADPETRCQVWHYCDLNGGQASFLCPNGTIFSQAALTCDWWFNVRCASTAQLYVLNESLYKYILPHSPKFPEDYSGPLVDKYLTLKFKEMEEQFKKNKNKSTASEKIDSDGNVSTEVSSEKSSEESDEQTDKSEVSVNESSVIVASPGSSGNVQRLEE